MEELLALLAVQVIVILAETAVRYVTRKLRATTATP